MKNQGCWANITNIIKVMKMGYFDKIDNNRIVLSKKILAVSKND